MRITSKFRTGFWIQSFIVFFAWLCITLINILYPFNNIQIDFRDISLWIGIFSAAWLIFTTRRFLIRNLKQISVTENEILIKSLLNNKIKSISFDQIMGFKTRREKSSAEEGTQVYGSEEFEIQLIDDSAIRFNADQFKNYAELKILIYTNYKSIQN